MKLIASSVIRGAKPGKTHGGLYTIDTDTGIYGHKPFSADFIGENERGGERGLRGIVVHGDYVYACRVYLHLSRCRRLHYLSQVVTETKGRQETKQSSRSPDFFRHLPSA